MNYAYYDSAVYRCNHYSPIRLVHRTLVDGVLHYCREAVDIFYSPIRLVHRTLVDGVLHYCREAVDIFYSPIRLGHRTLVDGVLHSCREAVDIFYSPIRLGHRTLVGGVLPLCREAVDVFYSPNKLGHRILVGGVLLIYRGVKQCIQTVYSTVPIVWAKNGWFINKFNWVNRYKNKDAKMTGCRSYFLYIFVCKSVEFPIDSFIFGRSQ